MLPRFLPVYVWLQPTPPATQCPTERKTTRPCRSGPMPPEPRREAVRPPLCDPPSRRRCGLRRRSPAPVEGARRADDLDRRGRRVGRIARDVVKRCRIAELPIHAVDLDGTTDRVGVPKEVDPTNLPTGPSNPPCHPDRSR